MARRRLSISYKILVILSLLVGITLNLINTSSVPALLSYYTLQSNIICLVAFACFLYLEIQNVTVRSDVYYLIKGAVVIAIFITAFVYACTLAPMNFEMDALQKSVANKWVANLFVHTISPILVIADYFLFDEKGRFKSYYPIIWLVIPFDYVLYVYLYSFSGGQFYSIGGSREFAYFFLDYQEIGYLGVAKWLLLITGGILAISFLLVLIDSKLGEKRRSWGIFFLFEKLFRKKSKYLLTFINNKDIIYLERYLNIKGEMIWECQKH